MFNEDDFLKTLEDYIIEEEANELNINLEEEYPAIDSDSKANFYLKLVKNMEEDIARINELCDIEIKKTKERINKYRESQIKPIERTSKYYKELLKNYTEHNIVGRSKSIKLPYGTLSLVKTREYDYGNEDDLKKWLEENEPEFVKVTLDKKIDKIKLKKGTRIDEEGNLVLEDGRKVPSVKAKEEDTLRLKFL